MNAENMYDAWDNGDRHEIRQQLAKRNKKDMTDRELMQQWMRPGAIVPVDMNTVRILLDALRERLAQPEQWEQLYPDIGNPFKRPATRDEKIVNPGVYEVQPETVMSEYKFQTYAAYKTPDGEMKIGVVPAMKEGKDFTISKPWVGLTATEVHETEGYEEDRKLYRFARAIEAKLKEKNNG
jgi:hypothetical protein